MRPKNFDEFVGQEQSVRQICLALESAIAREDVIDHVLLSGPPGLGKTTIANIIANMLGTRCVETIANVLKSPADAITSLVNLRRGDVLFIDEIHALPIVVQEYLYTAMEDYKIATISGQRARRVITIDLHKFVLVGATTMEGNLTGPMHDRFGIVCRLKPYTEEDLVEIIRRATLKMNVQITDAALSIIANRARATPRVALRQLRRIYDSATVIGTQNLITEDAAMHCYEILGIRRHGLTEQDIAVLRELSKTSYAVGVAALAASTHNSTQTIETVIEPHLMRIGAIQRTPRGRKITDFGKSLIK